MTITVPYRFGDATQYDRLFPPQVDADFQFFLANSREKLTANINYTAPGNFTTIQAALDYIAANVDLGGFTITIQLSAAGSPYAGATATVGWTGAGRVKIVGDTTTPASIVISTTGNCFTIGSADGPSCQLDFEGVKFVSTNGTAISVLDRSVARITGKVDFGTCGGMHLNAIRGGEIGCATGTPYTISGNAINHINLNQNCVFHSGAVVTFSGTITFAGTVPAITDGFILATRCASANVSGMTFVGSFVGRRYVSNTNAAIDTVGGGVGFFPGTVAGTTDGFGCYA